MYRVYIILLVLKTENRTFTFKGLFYLCLHIWLLLALWLSSQNLIFLFAFRHQDQTRPVRQIQMKRKGCGRWMWVQTAGTALGRCCLARRCQTWKGFSSRVGLLKFTGRYRIAGFICYWVFIFAQCFFLFLWFLLSLWFIIAKMIRSPPETAECLIQESDHVQEEEEYSWVLGPLVSATDPDLKCLCCLCVLFSCKVQNRKILHHQIHVTHPQPRTTKKPSNFLPISDFSPHSTSAPSLCQHLSFVLVDLYLE